MAEVEKQAKLVELGIVERIGDHKRIRAITKSRYSDFHVFEIDSTGAQVRLTDLAPPKETQLKVSVEDEELQKVLPEGTVEKVENIQTTIDGKGYREAKPVEIDVTDLDKDQRTRIHRWISNYPSLGSRTVDKDDKKFIYVEYASNKMKNMRRPASRAKFTHCVLYKEGLETSECIMQISKKLKMSPKLITYCGTKDKRAKTTQRICLSNIEARRLVEVSNQARNYKMGNYEYKPSHLFLGDLKGNHFKLLLKEAALEDGSASDQAEFEQALETAVNSLKEQGFINYYGLQRFGSFEISTHAVGKALLQNRWERAFDMILAPKSNDPDFMRTAKEDWLKTKNAESIIRKLPTWHRSIESNLLYGLARYYGQKDWISAFSRVPRNVRILYVHAFQSYLWNRVASERIKKFGLKPVIGDIVYVDSSNAVVEDFSLCSESTDIDTVEVPTVQDQSDDNPKAPPSVKVLKEGDLDNYSVFDVLIPLLGAERLPLGYNLQTYYEDLLVDNGLTQDAYANYKMKSDAPRGAFRHLLVKPTEVEHKVIPYSSNESTDNFIPSDYELLTSKNGDNKGTDGTSTEKTKLSVVIEFSLPSSSYATMALREILTEASSAPYQAPASTTEGPKSGEDGPAEKKMKLDE